MVSVQGTKSALGVAVLGEPPSRRGRSTHKRPNRCCQRTRSHRQPQAAHLLLRGICWEIPSHRHWGCRQSEGAKRRSCHESTMRRNFEQKRGVWTVWTLGKENLPQAEEAHAELQRLVPFLHCPIYPGVGSHSSTSLVRPFVSDVCMFGVSCITTSSLIVCVASAVRDGCARKNYRHERAGLPRGPACSSDN